MSDKDKIKILKEALVFYSGPDYKEVNGEIIEYDPDAGPLYSKVTIPLKDNGQRAREALEKVESEKEI